MSDIVESGSEQASCEKGQCSAVLLTILPKEKDLGEFSVRRVLPAIEKRMVGPWIFFDHMGPAIFPPGEGISVRPHPHINLATVTYLFEGEILHRDSLGYEQPICPGDINLMVAGKGIVHSERERPEVTAVEHRLHGLQLWMALPEEQEETDPGFYHYPDADIPAADIDGVPVRVMMGSAYGKTSPVKTFANTLYVEAHIKAGQSLVLPDAEEVAVYMAAGKLEVDGHVMETYSMSVMNTDRQITVTATEDARIGIIGGEAMPHRHMFWNFASSSKARIEQAKDDWKNGRFPKVPGDEEEFIPLP